MEELLNLALEGLASRKVDNGEEPTKKKENSPKFKQKPGEQNSVEDSDKLTQRKDCGRFHGPPIRVLPK